MAHYVTTQDNQRILVVPPDAKTVQNNQNLAAVTCTIAPPVATAAPPVTTAPLVTACTAAVPAPAYAVFRCVHCDCDVLINRRDINCGILRHAIYRTKLHPTAKMVPADRARIEAENKLIDPTKPAGEPINPHAPKAECDALIASGAAVGCGRPLRFDGERAVACDYI